MTEPTDPRVTHIAVSSARRYRLNEIGRAAIRELTKADAEFAIRDLGVSDRVTLSVAVGMDGVTLAVARLDVPASMLDEIATPVQRTVDFEQCQGCPAHIFQHSAECVCVQYDEVTGDPIPCYC